MASANPFDLLVDDDTDDVSQLVQKLPPPVKKLAAPAQAAAAQLAKSAKLPSKPLPPAQAVREARTDGQRGGGRTGGRGTGRGRNGRFSRDSADNVNSFGSSNSYSGGYRQPVEGDLDKSSERRGYGAPRDAPRGGHRGGFSNGEVVEGGERPRRVFDRHSGTGRGNEYSKRDGAGRGNWGTPSDDIAPETEALANDVEKNIDGEKQLGQEDGGDTNKENPVAEPEEKEPEVKEMTLEEYEKVLEEKRKALLALKAEERKVSLDKDLESMQLLSCKKNNDEIFAKLGAEKDKRKDATEKEERAKKALSINEFLKPAEGENYYGPGSRGRGRGRGPRGGFGRGNNSNYAAAAPAIEDVNQFPSLGAK